MDFLHLVAQHHKEWVKTVKGLGGGDYAEDIVQEMYLKLHRYGSYEKVIQNGKVSKGYVFFALKSILITYFNAKKRIDKQDVEGLEFIDDNELEYSEDLHTFCGELEKELDELHWFDANLFRLYMYSGDSFRTIAKNTGISVTTIFNSIKQTKRKLKKSNYLKTKYHEF